MIGPILDRLNARIAAEPALTGLDTLFVDLQDARDAIAAAENFKAIQPAPAAAQPAPAYDVSEAVTLLKDAKERLAVNSLSAVGDNIDKVIKILGD